MTQSVINLVYRICQAKNSYEESIALMVINWEWPS